MSNRDRNQNELKDLGEPLVDRVALNRHIEHLIESKGANEEARGAIIAFTASLASSRVQLEVAINRPGGKIGGQTPSHGLVEIEDSQDRTTEVSYGDRRERVGYYKIARYKHRKQYWIVIEQFWKSDLGTESETELTQQWVLVTDGCGVALWFGERAIRSICTLRLTKTFSLEIGREVYPESWGPAVGKVHNSVVRVNVVVDRRT